MASSKIKHRDVAFSASYTDITSDIPCEVPHSGFLKMTFNPSTTSGGKYTVTVYEESNVGQTYNIQSHTGDKAQLVIPVAGGAYINSASTSTGTGNVYYKKAHLV